MPDLARFFASFFSHTRLSQAHASQERTLRAHASHVCMSGMRVTHARGGKCVPLSRLWRVGLSCFVAFSGCESTESDAPLVTTDATGYFPIEAGHYWLLFDDADQFLTLSFDRETSLGGHTVQVLSFTFDFDPTVGEPVGPAYDLYLADEGEAGIKVYGWQDHRSSESVNLLPGGVLASVSMERQAPVITSTAANGVAAAYQSTLVEEGVIPSYFGEFPEGVQLQAGLEGQTEEQLITWFLAQEVGPVKLEWNGVRYQLYDYGAR